MNRRKRFLGPWVAAFLTVSVIAAWLALAPVQLGGPLAYIIINGNSMEPAFYRGDLVITQHANSYQVGDVIAYRHPQIGIIIHRIVGENLGRFILKGDHNTWLDSHQPSPAEVIGKSWVKVRGMGKFLEKIRSPEILATLTVLLTGVVALTAIVPSPSPQPVRRGGRRVRLKNEALKRINEQQDTVFFVLGVLAFGSFLLGVVAFARPLTQIVTDSISYEHHGKFTYSAAAPPNVYDSDSIQTGDPIFSQLTNLVKVNFEYQMLSDEMSSVSGSYRLVAEISDSVNNWKRTIELQPKSPFTGNTFAVSGVIDLDKLHSLVRALNEKTGVARQQYMLTVIPEVMVQGTLEGHTIGEQFAPRLDFHVSDLELYLAPTSPTDSGDPLNPMQIGVYQKPRAEANTIPIFSFRLRVDLARLIASAGLIASLLGMAGLSTLQAAVARRGENDLIQLKYGAMMVVINGDDPVLGKPVVDVDNIDDLVKLAEREGRMILHDSREGAHQYYVQDVDVVYRYRLKGTEGPYTILPEHEATVDAWVRTLALSKIEDREQIIKLADLTIRLARKMGIPESQIVHIRWGVLLHDIGKIAVPDHILLKSGPLSNEEQLIMRNSPAYAHEMLASMPYLQPALEIPYCHHERWDGTGYPRGLSGEAIPLAARIFAVVEVWDAIQSDRPYRAALSAELATQYLLEQSGKHFDPQVVQAFLELEGIQSVYQNDPS